MFFSLIVNACSAGQTCGASEDGTRPTSRVSQSPLSAPLARSKNHQKHDFACANLLVEPWNQAPGMGAVGVILIPKLRMQQVLIKLDPLWDPLRPDPAFQKLCEEKQP
jgi:hypothetical protein